MDIVDLKLHPQLRDVVADRIWQCWWRHDGYGLRDVQDALDGVMASDRFPFTLVATDNGVFVGTVTAIQTDIAERPELGPCIAALWVEPDRRRAGVARTMMGAALARLAEAGATEAFLAAKAERRQFYDRLGWTLIETGVGSEALDIFLHALP